MLTCPSGHPGAPGQRFCKSCGQPFGRQCPAGHDVPAHATFCGFCGVSMEPAPAPTGSIHTTKSMVTAETISRSGLPMEPHPPGSTQQEPPAPKRRSSRLALILSAVAVVALAGGIAGGVALSSGGTPRVVQRAGAITPGTAVTAGSGGGGPIVPATGDSTSTTATTVDAAASSAMAELAQLLAQSASVRSTVEPAIDGVTSCNESPSSAESTVQQAASTRQQILSQLQSLDASAVPQGSTMVQDLEAAMQDSVNADQGYVSWMQDVDSSGSCSSDPTQDSNFEAGQSASQQADTDKANFANLWNAVAGQYGQQPVSANSF